ncbi:phage virion morphogenesis protein [Candidatus Magnetaquicoccus inordinatus]|uniref:phage virion morphogenesis protein n=1 Tax=Candidatus Magnetaquicoccus inordinatus TaxID=2496818 RepID=UPI00102D1C23|nr:phage virion morphogenesis protein [Candidatus Magnetaquicoccus inordinatus]
MTDTIKINVGDQAINSYLQRLQAITEDMAPVMRRVAGIMKEAVETNFSVGGRPSWHPLTKAYLKQKKEAKFGDKILIRTGQLQRSITASYGADFAMVGTNLEYAAIHQFGGDITIPPHRREVYFHLNRRTGEVGNKFVKKAKSNFAQEVDHPGGRITIPARPYLQLAVSDLETIRSIVQQAITNPS